MDSDEDQQALAWQQIIKNRAFYNVRVRRGESWVDAACRTLDELVDQKEQSEKSLSEFLASQLTPRDDLPTCGETIDALNRNRDALVENREQSISSLQRLLVTAEAERDQARRERDEWRESADKWHGAWQRSAPVPISSADIDRALINVISNAMNYPNPSQMLGKDTGPLRKKCVDAVCALFGIEAEPADPVEAKARELYEVVRSPEWLDWDQLNDADHDEYYRLARHVLGQEDRHVDQ